MTGSWHLEQGDCVEVVRRWAADGIAFDSVVTDPPFNLESIARRFGKAGSAPAQFGRDGAANRLSRGFMGAAWDDSVAMRPETWEAIGSAVRPSARILAFGGTRTWHRMACAMEDAGLEIEDTIVWTFGQGLVLRRSRLKPGWSPIVLARRPGPAMDLDIDGCRVEAKGRPLVVGSYKDTMNATFSGRMDGSLRGDSTRIGTTDEGRWPANLLHDGSPEVEALFPDAPGQIADASPTAPSDKTGSTYGRLRREGEATADKRYSDRGCTNFAAGPGMRRNDAGSAARFFNACPESDEDDIHLLYHAKVPRGDKVYLCNICSTHFSHSSMEVHRHGMRDWKHVTAHPTQKPVSLLRHLVRLVTPRGGLVLEPFGGTGTTVQAAVAEGFDCMAVEKEATFCDAIRHRMAGGACTRAAVGA